MARRKCAGITVGGNVGANLRMHPATVVTATFPKVHVFVDPKLEYPHVSYMIKRAVLHPQRTLPIRAPGIPSIIALS